MAEKMPTSSICLLAPSGTYFGIGILITFSLIEFETGFGIRVFHFFYQGKIDSIQLVTKKIDFKFLKTSKTNARCT